MLLPNPHADPGFTMAPPPAGPRAVHARLPGYARTPLRDWPQLARELGVASVHVKDESRRLGLPAYKVLGASWAMYRAAADVLGMPVEPWQTLAELRSLVAPAGPRKLVTASDGNHGRGVARVARWLEWPAEVYLPRGTLEPRLDAVRGEGAKVVVVNGTYDEAVAAAAEAGARPGTLLLQDHGWAGYETIPGWVAEGYDTIFAEVDEQLEELGKPGPTLVLVQIGVGTLASAVVRHYKAHGRVERPGIAGVEPVRAACGLRSVAAGSPVMLDARAGDSIMAGLVCGTPSSAAWPALLRGIETYIAVDDGAALEAVQRYRELGVESGESGAAGLAGLLSWQRRGWPRGPGDRVLLLVTEGCTGTVDGAAAG